MSLHYQDSHVKKNRLIVNVSNLTMLMEPLDILSPHLFLRCLSRRQLRESFQALGSSVCVHEMTAAWAAYYKGRRKGGRVERVGSVHAFWQGARAVTDPPSKTSGPKASYCLSPLLSSLPEFSSTA